jgi:hypothetical protein
VDEQIVIFWPKDEARSKLERILSEAVLSESCGFGASPRGCVVATQQMEQVCRLQFCNLVRNPVCIHHERKRDARLLSKQPRIIHIPQADGSEVGTCLFELVFVFAQLRDMLTAENSAVVAEKDHHGWAGLP